MNDLAGKIAVITGGGSGIGRGMALAFAEAGMHVVIGDIQLEAAERVCGEVEARGVSALAESLDVTSREAVQAFADRIYARYGAVHLLCNNAGVVTFGPMHEIQDRDWRWTLAVDLDGVIHGLQAFLPRMTAQAGEKHIVNTASIAGIYPHEGIAPYVAAKYAVVGISETLHAERKLHGVGCSVLCPGNVRTEIVASGRNRPAVFGGADHTQHEDVQAQISAGMDAEEVGRVVRQAVLDDELYVFTHPETRIGAEERFRAILAAFDRCAERAPSRTRARG